MTTYPLLTLTNYGIGSTPYPSETYEPVHAPIICNYTGMIVGYFKSLVATQIFYRFNGQDIKSVESAGTDKLGVLLSCPCTVGDSFQFYCALEDSVITCRVVLIKFGSLKSERTDFP